MHLPTDQLATNRAGWRCKKEMQFRRRRLLTRGTFPIFRWNMGVCRGMVSESRLSSRFLRVTSLCLSSQKISTYLDFASIIVEVKNIFSGVFFIYWLYCKPIFISEEFHTNSVSFMSVLINCFNLGCVIVIKKERSQNLIKSKIIQVSRRSLQ